MEQRHILVVEDEPLIAMVFEDTLLGSGFRVTVTGDGIEALAADEADPADAVVTDLRMPGMGGRDLILRLRDRRPDLPILVVSGWLAEAGDLTEDRSTAFLLKPVSPQVLAARVAELLD